VASSAAPLLRRSRYDAGLTAYSLPEAPPRSSVRGGTYDRNGVGEHTKDGGKAGSGEIVRVHATIKYKGF